jgi:hypothetical protein
VGGVKSFYLSKVLGDLVKSSSREKLNQSEGLGSDMTGRGEKKPPSVAAGERFRSVGDVLVGWTKVRGVCSLSLLVGRQVGFTVCLVALFSVRDR